MKRGILYLTSSGMVNYSWVDITMFKQYTVLVDTVFTEEELHDLYIQTTLLDASLNRLICADS